MGQLISLAQEYAHTLVPYIVLAAVFFQITPIPISPITWALKKLGFIMNTDIIKHIKSMQRDLDDVKIELRDKKVEDLRWNILDFSNSCRNGRRHTREEWDHVIKQLDDYAYYTEINNIKNGVINEEDKYLRELFRERLADNDFL